MSFLLSLKVVAECVEMEKSTHPQGGQGSRNRHRARARTCVWRCRGRNAEDVRNLGREFVRSRLLLNFEDLTAYKIAYSAVDERTESTHKSQKGLVDVTGLEPVTPCLQTRQGKTLTALSGVAYTENQRNFRSLKCPEVVPNRSGRVVEGGVLKN